MSERKQRLADAAIRVLGKHGVRALTHRAVDAEAGVPVGSAANLFATREALLEAIVERVVAIERDHFDEIALKIVPRTPADLAHLAAGMARDAAGVHRAVTLSRYAILVEAGHNPAIRRQLSESGSRVNTWFASWLRLVGSHDPDRDVHVVGNYLTGLVLHQLAIPDPDFDPTDNVVALLESLVGPRPQQKQRAPAPKPARASRRR